MEGVFIYETEKALVRIHPGKRTEAEQRKALEESAKQFYKSIQKDLMKKGGTNDGRF